MAVVVSRPSVTTVATLIASNTFADKGGSTSSDVTTTSFVVKNVTGTVSVFLGPAGVTTANGFEWVPADGRLSIDLEPGESLYGIVTVAPQVVHALAAGR